jgi:hypothetical protein
VRGRDASCKQREGQWMIQWRDLPQHHAQARPFGSTHLQQSHSLSLTPSLSHTLSLTLSLSSFSHGTRIGGSEEEEADGLIQVVECAVEGHIVHNPPIHSVLVTQSEIDRRVSWRGTTQSARWQRGRITKYGNAHLRTPTAAARCLEEERRHGRGRVSLHTPPQRTGDQT